MITDIQMFGYKKNENRQYHTVYEEAGINKPREIVM
jgi:hypothetical protein